MHVIKLTYRDYNQIRGVAKFGIALRSGRRGRRFKSCHLDCAGIECVMRMNPWQGHLGSYMLSGFFLYNQKEEDMSTV